MAKNSFVAKVTFKTITVLTLFLITAQVLQV